jgi:membrane protein DedA with SNARE-associated domain
MVTVLKIINPLALPGLIFSGFIRVPFKEFFWTTLFLNIIHAIVFSLIGYYSGVISNRILQYFGIGKYFIVPVIVILVVLAYYLVGLIYKLIVKKINLDSIS